ncbi:hypothetical protein AQY21_20565 [Paracoccus sp. MKU1]|nr:hypothetical protein AQY21_20565 [Paracoccus sp. MKU1]
MGQMGKTRATDRVSKREARPSRYHDKQIEQGVFAEDSQSPKTLKRVVAKTNNQIAYMSALKGRAQVIFVSGPPGTGKTYMAAHVAAEMFAAKDVRRIILARPNVPAGPTLGLFAGTLEEKIAHWAVPLIEVLTDVLGRSKVEYALKNKQIDIVPFETMRGRTFDNAFVILDEGQNTTPGEMEMFLTRLGEGCKVVVNGDMDQKDISGMSGLAHAIRVSKEFQIDGTCHVAFGMDDIVRSGICGAFTRAFWSVRSRGPGPFGKMQPVAPIPVFDAV